MKIVCFSDSHGYCFENVFPHLAEVETHPIVGATLIGFAREQTKLRTKQTVLDSVPALEADDYIALMFGQTDIEFVYYHKVIVKNEQIDFETFARGLIETYLDVLLEIRLAHPHLVVCGIGLPTIFDQEHAIDHTLGIITEGADRDELIEAYRVRLAEIFPTAHERTRMAIDFNASLRKACQAHGIPYFDLISEMLDKRWGLVSSRFRSFPVDHHYPFTYEVVELFTLKLILTVKGLT